MRRIKMTVNKGFSGVVFILVLALGLIIFSSGSLWASVEVSFRLSGSPLGYLQNGAGDIDQTRKGVQANLADLANDPRYSTSFSWDSPSCTNDLRAEVLFKISRHFGISIGSGYLFANNRGVYTMDYDNKTHYEGYYYYWDSENQEDIDFNRSYAVSAIPITLDTYFFLPIGKGFNIFAHVGGGLYFGKMEHVIDLDDTYHYRSWENGVVDYWSEGIISATMIEKTNSLSWGYHGGLGLEVKIARFISFGAEAFGRHIDFRDWKGSQVIEMTQKGKSWSWWGGEKAVDNSETESAFGNLWTYTVKGTNGESNYTMMLVLDEEPEGEYYTNARKSSIDLNSCGLTVSLKLSFNLF